MNNTVDSVYNFLSFLPRRDAMENIITLTNEDKMQIFLGMVAIAKGHNRDWGKFQHKHNSTMMSMAKWLEEEEGHKCVVTHIQDGFVYITWCQKTEIGVCKNK